jgi:purine-binding chemotaxis protein CheW
MPGLGPDDTVDVFCFELSEHPFALLVSDVHAIVRAVAPTPLPGAPAAVLGTIDVGGARLPLYDLRARLGLSPRAIRAQDVILLVGSAAPNAAIVVDQAAGITRVARGDIAAAQLRFPTSPLVAGIVTLAEGTRVLYDLDRFLSATEAADLSAALLSRSA